VSVSDSNKKFELLVQTIIL